MKNLKLIFTVMALAAISYSCNNSAVQKMMEEPENPGMVKYETNQKLYDKAFDLFCDNNLDEFEKNVSEDVLWHPPHGDSLAKSDWSTTMKMWHENFENFKFTNRQYFPGVDEAFEPNGSVRVYGAWSFSHKETGMEFSNQKWYSVANFNDNGQQDEIWEYFDQSHSFLKLLEASLVEAEE
tara:strand:- start:720 stop:1262 length:543 start_codon:yes stop_codon:yes gene_type:complete